MDKSGKILILDDETMVTKTLAMLLGFEGFSNVKSFNSPKDALLWLKDNEIDLIISDFIMPEMNGIDFLSEAIKTQQNVTTILLTGYADKENAIRAINEIGIFKYIEKPWENTNLIISVKNALLQTKLKKELAKKIEELEAANAKLEKYSKNLEDIVKERTMELESANSKLNAIFSNCADGIILFDDEFKIFELNQKAVSLLGQNRENIINQNIFSLMVNEKKQILKSDLNSDKPLYLRDYYLINYKQDVKIPVEISIAPVQHDKKTFYVAVVRDVTYQKEAQRLRDDFIATLTHDLKTPLLASISGIDFILDGSFGKVNEEQNNIFKAMKKSSEDMLGLVNTLLAVYKYEAGENYLTKTKFDIVKLVSECVELLEPLSKNTGIKLLINSQEDEIYINADKNEIRRVLMNLIANALNHSQKATKTQINIIKDNKNLKVEVEDDGVGISEQDCEKLFKRFSQGTNNRRSSSTGLGLYLSRQIIEAHGGKISVNSKLNEGATFSFELQNSINDCKVAL